MRRVLIILLIALTVIASPCMNDRDTLGYELHNKPDLQRALTGRFDRYPALYYQMRVQRLRAKSSLTTDEYDDLAVALARLGKNQEGLEVLAQKANHASLNDNDRYRLFANRGTLRAHKWFQDGAKKENIALLKAAESDITIAIRINDKAHFGREGAQLEMIRWIIYLRTTPEPDTHLGDWMVQEYKDGKPTLSLAGLIMLGGAWESPDVALAIGYLEKLNHGQETPGLALARYRELVAAGHKSMTPDLAQEMIKAIDYRPTMQEKTAPPSTEQRFKELRREANAWHEQKTDYMLSQLQKGKHPDTDSDFWAGWHEPPMPRLPVSKQDKEGITVWGIIRVLVLILVGALLVIGLVLRDKRRARAGA